MAKHFNIGDEVALSGVVRLLDVGGPNTVTIELHATGQRITVMADSTSVELVARAKGGAGFTKALKGQTGTAHSRSRIGIAAFIASYALSTACRPRRNGGDGGAGRGDARPPLPVAGGVYAGGSRQRARVIFALLGRPIKRRMTLTDHFRGHPGEADRRLAHSPSLDCP